MDPPDESSYAKGWQNKNFGSDKTPSLKLKLMSANLLGIAMNKI